MIYKVIRPHFGDRMYFEGDTRELDEATAASLVRSGILAELVPPQEPPQDPNQNTDDEEAANKGGTMQIDTINVVKEAPKNKNLVVPPKNKSKQN